MFLLMIFLVLIFVALGTGVLAALSDFRGLTIPNNYSLVILATFLVCYAVLWMGGRDDVFDPPLSHILAPAIVFGVTLLMFMAKVLGAADSKMASAFAFWTGLKGLMPFLFYMALAGGILGLVGLLIRKYKPFKSAPEGSWIATLQAGESKVPYGIAIMLGALASFLELGYLSPEVLSSFLLG